MKKIILAAILLMSITSFAQGPQTVKGMPLNRVVEADGAERLFCTFPNFEVDIQIVQNAVPGAAARSVLGERGAGSTSMLQGTIFQFNPQAALSDRLPMTISKIASVEFKGNDTILLHVNVGGRSWHQASSLSANCLYTYGKFDKFSFRFVY